jgi:hypothetical protein
MAGISGPRIGSALLIAVLALSAFGPGAAALSAASHSREGVPSFGHVFLIIGENTDYSHLNPTNAPYLFGTIEPSSAWFTNYFAATHWSEANYVALVSGQYNACEQADGSPASCHQNVDNLFHQLDGAGLTWRTWLDGGNAACPLSYTTTEQSSSYFTTGNPPTIFDDIEGPNGVWSATAPSQECLTNDIPAGPAVPPFEINATGMATFNADLATGAVGNFNFIVPNGCNSADSNCAPIHDRYTQFDNFLAREVPLIEASPAYAKDGVIIVVFDEAMRQGGMAQVGFGQGGHTVCALISPLAVPGDYSNTTYAYSVLRTLQDGFGLPNYLGSAVDVVPLPLVWK